MGLGGLVVTDIQVGIARPPEIIQPQTLAEFPRAHPGSLIQRDPDTIGHSDQAVKTSHCRCRLHQSFLARSGEQLSAHLGEFLASSGRGLGEGDEKPSMGNPSIAVAHRCIEFRFLANRLAARTEQQYMRGRSVETLVHRGHPSRDEFDLGAREGAFIPDQFGEALQRVHAADQSEKGCIV
jgi:hypothetical protein